MSPPGIGYMYCSEDMKTCLDEIRAVIGEKYWVGEFTLTNSLKIIDIGLEPNLRLKSIFNVRYNHEMLWARNFVRGFSTDISIPIAPGDAPLEYVPTQVVAEYLRHRGNDGIRFASSLAPNKYNVTLFRLAESTSGHIYESVPEALIFYKTMYLSTVYLVEVNSDGSPQVLQTERFSESSYSSLRNRSEGDF